MLNLTNDGYYMPKQSLNTIDDLLAFLNGILDGKVKVCEMMLYDLYSHLPLFFVMECFVLAAYCSCHCAVTASF